MTWLRRLFSPCWLWGHEEPIKVPRGKALVLVCPACTQDVRTVLPRQRFKKRAEGKVVKFSKRRSA